VIPTVLMIPLSIGVSVALIPIWGATGSVLGSVVAVFCCQVVPYYIYVVRDLRRRGRAD